MKAIQGYRLIEPKDLFWRPSNLMQIPNADYLERTGSENLSARLWRLPPRSANTLHKHIRQEEFYFVLEGVGRMRVHALAPVAEAAAGSELVHCLGIDRDLPHLAGDAPPDPLVQTLAEFAAKGQRNTPLVPVSQD
jgi:quercetin dioxygenase-like cupin family protein